MKRTVILTIVSVANIIFPLVIGTFCYLIFSKNAFPIAQNFKPLEMYSKLQYNAITYFFRFYFSDAMWAYSLFYSLATVFYEKKRFPYLAIISGFATVVFIETLQLKHVIHGTFDIFDIIVEFVMGITGVFIFYRTRRNLK